MRYVSQRDGDITLLVRDRFAASHFAPVLLDLLMGVVQPAAVADGKTQPDTGQDEQNENVRCEIDALHVVSPFAESPSTE